ncbi:MAG: DUF4102 domain-containing protein [Hyphomicrobiaceae bacterium]|nr:MAG: DUF4102 domain-containing protein [Hyphomicrobiaceae bacterium]
MPKRSELLLSTDREIAGAAPPPTGGDKEKDRSARAEYRIAGTPNLVLRVSPKGRRTWVYWLKRPKTGTWQRYTIGEYPTVGLARARREAVRLDEAVFNGVDPIDLREEARNACTVEELGEAYVTRHAKPKKRSWTEDERNLKKDVYPTMGKIRAGQVTRLDVARLLDRIHDRGAPIQANRTLALVRKLFNFAVAEGYVQSNPASGIPMRAKETARTRILSPDEIKAFWSALEKAVGFDDVTADALRLQLLLGARVSEVTGMMRAELDLDAEIPLWTLPKARAKAGRDVPRPLPGLALTIIERRLCAAGDRRFVFASPLNAGQPITAHATARAVHRAGSAGRILPLPPRTLANGRVREMTARERAEYWNAEGFTPHDLRRTCRTCLAKLAVPETVAKKILGHAPQRADVTASVYDQHTYTAEMHEALQRWEKHVAAIVMGP